MTTSLTERFARGQRAALGGLLANLALVLVKFLAGVFGHSYALIADAVESGADVFSSLVVWSGLRIASRDPSDEYPFGYGKAEPLAAVVVGVMLLVAAVGVAFQAIHEIRTPHFVPAPWTLGVLAVVILTKEVLFRRVFRVAREVESTAVQGDAWHHRSDALTSAAAGVGITVAVLGGPGWESADDWAALVAAGVIAWSGYRVLRPAIADLMDVRPEPNVLARIVEVAGAVPGVLAIEKLAARRSGLALYVDIHVEADPAMSLAAAHNLSGAVKGALQRELPNVRGVLVHMEPHRSSAGQEEV